MLINILFFAVLLGAAELLLLYKMAQTISFIPTLLICSFTAALGTYLARKKGVVILTRIREELHAGMVPGDSIIEGIVVLFAGFMLLFPGVLTDAAGFLLLIPGNRRLLRDVLKKRFQGQVHHRQL